MKAFSSGELTTWGELSPGALFLVSISGETHIAMKLRGESEGDEYFSCAVLTESPPGYVVSDVVKNVPLNFLPHASLVPAANLSKIQFSNDGPQVPPGSLILTSQGLCAVLKGSPRKFFFRVEDGQIVNIEPPFAVISAWQIVVPGVDEHEVIFNWSTPTS